MKDQVEKFKELPDSVLATAINILTNNWFDDYSDSRAAAEMRSVLEGHTTHARAIGNYMSCIDFLRIAIKEPKEGMEDNTKKIRA